MNEEESKIPPCPHHGSNHMGFACDTAKGILEEWYCRKNWDLRAYGDNTKPDGFPCSYKLIIPVPPREDTQVCPTCYGCGKIERKKEMWWKL